MPDQPLTLLQAAFMEAVRPTAAGRVDRVRTLLEQDPLAAHGCLHAAVVIDRGRRVWYPCRSHEGDVHHYAAHWPACPGPWCRLPYEHHVAGTMHIIPGGRVEYHDAIGVIDHG